MKIIDKLPMYDREIEIRDFVLKNYEIDQILNLEEHKRKKREFAQTIEWKKIQKYKKEYFTTLHGFMIYFVDQDALIGGRKAGHFDYTMGGHGYRYLYIPDDEIWIDKNTTPRSLWPLVWHEYYEAIRMKGGQDYDKAHYAASLIEIQMRTTDEEGRPVVFNLPVRGTETEVERTGLSTLAVYLDFLGALSGIQLPEKECSFDEIPVLATQLGFSAVKQTQLTREEIKYEIFSGNPLIVSTKTEDGQELNRLIVGYTDGKLTVFDPRIGDFTYIQADELLLEISTTHGDVVGIVLERNMLSISQEIKELKVIM